MLDSLIVRYLSWLYVQGWQANIEMDTNMQIIMT